MVGKKDFEKFEDVDAGFVDDTEDVDKTDDVEDEKKYEIPCTIKLSSPVSKKDEIIFSRKCNGEMTKNVPMDPSQWRLGHLDPVIAAMTGWPVTLIRQLEDEDLAAVRSVVLYFLPRGLAIGGKSKE